MKKYLLFIVLQTPLAQANVQSIHCANFLANDSASTEQVARIIVSSFEALQANHQITSVEIATFLSTTFTTDGIITIPAKSNRMLTSLLIPIADKLKSRHDGNKIISAVHALAARSLESAVGDQNLRHSVIENYQNTFPLTNITRDLGLTNVDAFAPEFLKTSDGLLIKTESQPTRLISWPDNADSHYMSVVPEDPKSPIFIEPVVEVARKKILFLGAGKLMNLLDYSDPAKAVRIDFNRKATNPFHAGALNLGAWIQNRYALIYSSEGQIELLDFKIPESPRRIKLYRAWQKRNFKSKWNSISGAVLLLNETHLLVYGKKGELTLFDLRDIEHPVATHLQKITGQPYDDYAYSVALKLNETEILLWATSPLERLHNKKDHQKLAVLNISDPTNPTLKAFDGPSDSKTAHQAIQMSDGTLVSVGDWGNISIFKRNVDGTFAYFLRKEDLGNPHDSFPITEVVEVGPQKIITLGYQSLATLIDFSNEQNIKVVKLGKLLTIPSDKLAKAFVTPHQTVLIMGDGGQVYELDLNKIRPDMYEQVSP